VKNESLKEKVVNVGDNVDCTKYHLHTALRVVTKLTYLYDIQGLITQDRMS